MEDFTFNDLNIKLGFPYLYCHQGDCEHVVVITDIRYVASLRILYLNNVLNWGGGRTHAIAGVWRSNVNLQESVLPCRL